MSFSTVDYKKISNIVYDNGNENVNISTSNPNTKILINGVEPSGGGGSQLPINGQGDITIEGNITANDQPGGGSKGIITASKSMSTGLGGLSSSGTIQTNNNADIVSARDYYFDGQDIYKVTNNQGQITNTAYYRYRNLAVKQEANEFTGENQFLDNQYFGTSDGQPNPTYTNKISLFNQTGNITSVGNVTSNSANIDTQITCGNITCDNGATNTCKARIFNTRTSGTNGWDIKQELENNAQSDNILQIHATQQQIVGKPVEIFITSSEYDPTLGHNPNIKLIPDTILNGGQVQASQVIFGTGTNRFQFKQDIGGTLDQVLQINARDASSEVRFRDNNSGNILVVKNNAIDLKNTAPLNFGLYPFRPIQLTYSFTGAGIGANPGVLFQSHGTTFTNVNTNTSGVSINSTGEGFYMLTVEGSASSGSTYGAFNFQCSFPYKTPFFSTGTVITEYTGNFSGTSYPAGLTTPVLCGFSSTSTDFKLCFKSVTSGSETYNGTVRLTKLDF